MVRSIDIADDGAVTIGLNLTVAGCPLKDTLTADTQREVGAVAGVTSVKVELGVMNDEERAALRTKLRGGVAEPEIPFTKPGSLTRVYAVTSGKGGVGKSSVTANLAAAMAAQGLNVGVVDADIYGFSIPRMLGVDHVPTQLDGMIVPPVSHGVKGYFYRHVCGRTPASGVAWPDAAPRCAAVPHRRVLGRPRRAAARPTSGNR